MAKGGKPYLRVAVVNGGCAGMEYVLDYADAPDAFDELVSLVPIDSGILEKSMPKEAADATSAARIAGQYGSANETCVVFGPS